MAEHVGFPERSLSPLAVALIGSHRAFLYDALREDPAGLLLTFGWPWWGAIAAWVSAPAPSSSRSKHQRKILIATSSIRATAVMPRSAAAVAAMWTCCANRLQSGERGCAPRNGAALASLTLIWRVGLSFAWRRWRALLAPDRGWAPGVAPKNDCMQFVGASYRRWGDSGGLSWAMLVGVVRGLTVISSAGG